MGLGSEIRKKTHPGCRGHKRSGSRISDPESPVPYLGSYLRLMGSGSLPYGSGNRKINAEDPDDVCLVHRHTLILKYIILV
jgi:hypothetical protein